MEAEFVSEPNLVRAKAAGPTVFVRRPRDLDPVAESPSNSRWSVRLDVPGFRTRRLTGDLCAACVSRGTECLRTVAHWRDQCVYLSSAPWNRSAVSCCV